MINYDELLQDFFAYLCPAGDGVYTVSSGKSYKQQLQHELYGSDENQKIPHWQQKLKTIHNTELPLLLGVPSDCGGGIQRGANWGPLFVRQALYKKIAPSTVFDLGDVRVIPQLLLDDYLNLETIQKCRQALYADKEIERAVSPLSITREVVKKLHHYFPQKKLFALGGDHSVSYPLVKEYLLAKKQQHRRCALLHFDAHTDLLKQRLGIDISFGSWTHHILNDLPSPEHLIQIGIRATGRDKNYWQNTLGIQQYWATEIKNKGVSVVADAILNFLKQQCVDEMYVTFDIDCLDAAYASATGTPETAGLTPSEVIAIINAVSREIPITGADLVEVAPFVKTSFDDGQEEPATTLENAANIAVLLLEKLKDKGLA